MTIQKSAYLSTARLDETRGNDFIRQINQGLNDRPHYALDNPFVLARLLDEYFSTIDEQDDFQHRLGRAAARYLQRIPSPMTDRIPKPLTETDVMSVVASTVARSINERRRISRVQGG